MAFVLVHRETGKYVARKGIQKGVDYRLTKDIGSVQIFNTKGSATSTASILKEEFERYRGYRRIPTVFGDRFDNLPDSDDFDLYPISEITLGERVDNFG